MKTRSTLTLLLALAGSGCTPPGAAGSIAGGSAGPSDREAAVLDPDEGLRSAIELIASGAVSDGAARVEAEYAEVRRHGVQPDDGEVLADLQASLLELGPDEISPMMLVNTTLALAGVAGPTEARAPLDDWVRRKQERYAPFVSLGHLALVLRDASAAETYFRRALDVRPSGKEALRGLGSLFAQTSRMDAALEVLLRASESDAEDASTHLQLGNVQLELDLQDDALRSWVIAIEHGDAKTRARSRLRRGALMLARGDLEAALGDFKDAVDDEPGNASSHFNVGQALHVLGRPAEAREHLVRSIELRPEYPHAHYLVGEIDELAGRTDDAEQHYRNALAVDTNHESARYRLSRLLRLSGLDEEADRVAAGEDG